MNVRIQLTLTLLTIIFLGYNAAAACTDPTARAAADNIATLLTTVGNACGVLMMVYLGIKWMVADDPQGRENARRGVIYIIIGLILLRTSASLVYYLMC